MKITVNYTPMGYIPSKTECPKCVLTTGFPATFEDDSMHDYYRTLIILVIPFLVLTSNN